MHFFVKGQLAIRNCLQLNSLSYMYIKRDHGNGVPYISVIFSFDRNKSDWIQENCLKFCSQKMAPYCTVNEIEAIQ